MMPQELILLISFSSWPVIKVCYYLEKNSAEVLYWPISSCFSVTWCIRSTLPPRFSWIVTTSFFAYKVSNIRSTFASKIFFDHKMTTTWIRTWGTDLCFNFLRPELTLNYSTFVEMQHYDKALMNHFEICSAQFLSIKFCICFTIFSPDIYSLII